MSALAIIEKQNRKIIAIINLQRGIACKRESPARAGHVPALCTHRSPLPPTEWFGAEFGNLSVQQCRTCLSKFAEPDHLREGQVVTRFPQDFLHPMARNSVTGMAK